MMGIFVRNWRDTQAKLRSLGFHCPAQYRKNYYQLITKPVLNLVGQDTKPKQRGTVFISEKELDQLLLMVNLGLSVDESIKGIVRSRFIKD